MPPVGEIDATEMSFNADGTFEMILSPQRPEGAQNWLQMAEGYTLFMAVSYTHLTLPTTPYV